MKLIIDNLQGQGPQDYTGAAALQDVDILATYAVNPQKTFSFHAAEIAVSVRGKFSHHERRIDPGTGGCNSVCAK